jgi:hypothetical protein
MFSAGFTMNTGSKKLQHDDRRGEQPDVLNLGPGFQKTLARNSAPTFDKERGIPRVRCAVRVVENGFADNGRGAAARVASGHPVNLECVRFTRI